jgi:hypothetical protein
LVAVAELDVIRYREIIVEPCIKLILGLLLSFENALTGNIVAAA